MNSQRDKNNITTMVGVLNTDGGTPTNIKIDPITNIMDVSDGIIGNDLGDDNASRDDNNVTTLMAVSESDNNTPIPLYVDSSGNLLIDST